MIYGIGVVLLVTVITVSILSIVLCGYLLTVIITGVRNPVDIPMSAILIWLLITLFLITLIIIETTRLIKVGLKRIRRDRHVPRIGKDL